MDVAVREKHARALEVVREDLDYTIRASEQWAPSYRKSPTTFRLLIRSQNKMETKLRAYFRGLADRAPNYVNWSEYTTRLMTKRADTLNTDVPPGSPQDPAVEEALVFKAVFDDSNVSVLIGNQAGQDLHSIPQQVDRYSDSIAKRAMQHVADLVKEITDTTKQQIRNSIEASLALGEDIETATKRLASAVDDRKRAEMIARTETVNSYGGGLFDFAKKTGAVTKHWEINPGACPVCVANHAAGEIPIDKPFPSGDMFPTAHPNCRCSVTYGYKPLEKKPKPAPQALSVEQGGIRYQLPLTAGERAFMDRAGITVKPMKPRSSKTMTITGFFTPALKTIEVKVDKAIKEKDAQALFYHELGHAIDYNADPHGTKPYRLTRSLPDVVGAVNKGKDYVVEQRLRNQGNIDPKAAAAYARGQAYNGRRLPPAAVKYMRSREEVFADGYMQWRADPAGFKAKAPELAAIYEGVLNNG